MTTYEIKERNEALQKMTVEEMEKLLDLGIKTVIMDGKIIDIRRD